MSFSQKQFSDTAVGLFSMIPIIGIPIANMFKSGLKSGSKMYYLSSKAAEEVMALFEKMRSVSETATAHSFAPGNLQENLLKSAKKLQDEAKRMGKVYETMNPSPSPPTTDAAPENNPFVVKAPPTSKPSQGGKRFTRRHAIRRKCRTEKQRRSKKH
jgi:hypothetical protein